MSQSHEPLRKASDTGRSLSGICARDRLRPSDLSGYGMAVMEMPVDAASIIVFSSLAVITVCLIVWAEWNRLRDDRRLDAEQERREKEAKKYFERGDGK